MKIVLIAVVAENGVIGSDGAVPESLVDMGHFQEPTVGHAVVLMGRRTFERVVEQNGEPLNDERVSISQLVYTHFSDGRGRRFRRRSHL